LIEHNIFQGARVRWLLGGIESPTLDCGLIRETYLIRIAAADRVLAARDFGLIFIVVWESNLEILGSFEFVAQISRGGRRRRRWALGV
jgi:hypothetical protein